MGCSVSAVEGAIKRKNQVSGSIKKADTMRQPVDNGNAKFDPRLPLTVRQKFNILKSWKGIARNIESTGIMMFLRLFETNEEVKSMFVKLVHDGKFNFEQLRDSKELENHVKQVMYTLDEAISSLEDVDNVKIQEPFLLAVKETLGDRYTANMEHIYRKTIQFILKTLVEGFNDN